MNRQILSKQEQKTQNTRKKIIRSATRLFARQGYHKTTISDIASDIKLTTGAVFHHFQTKDQILNAVIDRMEQGLTIYSDYLKSQANGSFKVIETMVGMMLSHFAKQPEATICLATLATEFAGSGHAMEARLKQAYEPFIESFSKVLYGHPQVKDYRAASIAILGAAHGIGIQGLFREGQTDVNAIAQSLLSFFKKW